MARRGRPTSVHPDRDRLIHFAVEWVMFQTGLGIGSGRREPTEPDACVIASWLLAGRIQRSEYAWLAEAVKINAMSFQSELTYTENKAVVLDQLRRVDHLTARLAYRKVQRAGAPKGEESWRSSVRDDVRRAERTALALAGESLPDADHNPI